MPKVYVVNLSEKDYSKAEKYGELVYMTHGVLDLRKHKQYEEKISKYLEGATEDDYLLLSGPTLICTIDVKVWFKGSPDVNCKILIWNHNDYREFII